VASLPVEVRDHWLDRAEKLHWSTKQLREGIRLAHEDEKGDVTRAEATRRLMIPGSHLKQWHRAAARSGIDLEQWVLTTLDQAAAMALEE
jgi:hypothetical protein